MTDRRKEFIAKAEELKPQLIHTDAYPVAQHPEPMKEGDSVIFDFGRHVTGYLNFHMHAEGHPCDAPLLVEFRFAEIRRELDEETGSYAGWICRSWIQQEVIHIDSFPADMTLPRRYAFRYVKVIIRGCSLRYSVVIDEMHADAVSSADERKLTVFHGTETEERIDHAAVSTLHECMQEVFEDGPKRDRRLWVGDLRLEALTNYCTYHDNDLVRRCLYLFAGCCDERGVIPASLFLKPVIHGDDSAMFDYSLLFVNILDDYCRHTGDLDTGKDLLETAGNQIENAKECFDENDVLKDQNALGWCFLDWNLTLNKQAGGQAVYLYALLALEDLYEMLGMEEKIPCIRKEYEKKKKAARNFLYDEKSGLFISGKDRQVSLLSQAWMVMAGVMDQKEAEGLMQRAVQADCLKTVTPYARDTLVEAMMKAGLQKEAYEVMTDYWSGMLEQGADTFWELYDPENPDTSPYGSPAVNSYCHAWSCSPSYLMRMCGLNEKELEKNG